jgi:hypothetical protein
MPRKKTSTGQFASGDTVRVKPGLADPDYPDIPIGGWAGQITEVEAGAPPTCLVRWNQQTLDSMHPVFRNRCERDGLDIEQMWIAQDDLERDEGQPVELDQPTDIQTKPLNRKDQDDRIRAVFGLTHDDPVPPVEMRTLWIFRDHLAERAPFPFEAQWKPDPRRFSSESRVVTVVGLGGTNEDERLDEDYGLICEIKIDSKKGDVPLAELQVNGRNAVRQLIDDYCYWFSNWR